MVALYSSLLIQVPVTPQKALTNQPCVPQKVQVWFHNVGLWGSWPVGQVLRREVEACDADQQGEAEPEPDCVG